MICLRNKTTEPFTIVTNGNVFELRHSFGMCAVKSFPNATARLICFKQNEVCCTYRVIYDVSIL